MDNIFERVMTRVEQHKENAFYYSMTSIENSLLLQGKLYPVNHSLLHIKRGNETLFRKATGDLKPYGNTNEGDVYFLASKSKNDIAANVVILDSDLDEILTSDMRPDSEITGFLYLVFTSIKGTIYHLLTTINISADNGNGCTILTDGDQEIGKQILQLVLFSEGDIKNE